MFDITKLKDVLVAYKQNFVSRQWGEEKYKWEAVEYSARDCAARPLKLSIHSGGIEHACRRR